MGAVRIIDTTTVQAPQSHINSNSTHKIDLAPWDLQFLKFESIQTGLLFQNPPLYNTRLRFIHHLKRSLSSTLSFFPPLAGRLAIVEHHEDNTVSAHIVCNNKGAIFVHAVADNTTVADILTPKYVPPVVHSFFQLNGVKNYEGTTQPLLAIQVTELVDGVFIGCTINHVVCDGKSFRYFANSWGEISRGAVSPSKLPSFDRYFPDGVDRPIRFPFTIKEEPKQKQLFESAAPAERIFHLTKEKIAKLKSKANADIDSSNKISSLQAILTLLCRSVIRCNSSQEDVIDYCVLTLDIDVRNRMVPPLPEEFFGNAVLVDPFVTMEIGELLELGGLGKSARKINAMIFSYTDEKIKKDYESWLRSPYMATASSVAGSNNLSTSSSPRFDVYGNEFGLGKPVAVRSGVANMRNGKITLYAGAEDGDIDVVVSFPREILEALANHLEFADAVK